MAKIPQGVHRVVVLLEGALLAAQAGPVVPYIVVDFAEKIGAPGPFSKDLAVPDEHGRGGNALPDAVHRVPDPEAPVPQLRFEACGAWIDDDQGIQVPAEEVQQVVRVFRVRLLALPGGGVPVILAGNPEGVPVVAYVQEHTRIDRAIVDGRETARTLIHSRTFILKRIGAVIPHGIHGAFRADPFPQDILTVKNALE